MPAPLSKPPAAAEKVGGGGGGPQDPSLGHQAGLEARLEAWLGVWWIGGLARVACDPHPPWEVSLLGPWGRLLSEGLLGGGEESGQGRVPGDAGSSLPLLQSRPLGAHGLQGPAYLSPRLHPAHRREK